MKIAVFKSRFWEIKEGNFVLLLLAIAILGGALRIAFAFLLPLDSDEAYQLLISKISLVQMLKATLSVYPPIWSLILHTEELISTNFVFIRIISSLIGVSSIIIIGYIGKFLFNSSKTALLVSAIFALSPTQIYHSANVRVYSLAILASLLCFWTFTRFLKNLSFKNNFLLFLSITFSNYVYYLFPALSLSFYFFLLSNLKKFKERLKIFTLIYLLSAVATFPLLLSFIRVEPVPKIILPGFSLEKIFLIPIQYTFAQNLALLMGSKILEITPFKGMLLGLSITNLLILIFLPFQKLKQSEKFLLIMLITPIVLVIIFSAFVFSVFGLRSVLIFSIPFYFLIGSVLIRYKKLIKIYLLFSVIVILSTLFFFIKRAPDELELFVRSNIKKDTIILHSEITTFYFFSYKTPQYKQYAAIDSLYTNQITKDLLDYSQADQNTLNSSNFWLIEILNSPLHEGLINQFKMEVQKTHTIGIEKEFPNVKIYEFKQL